MFFSFILAFFLCRFYNITSSTSKTYPIIFAFLLFFITTSTQESKRDFIEKKKRFSCVEGKLIACEEGKKKLKCDKNLSSKIAIKCYWTKLITTKERGKTALKRLSLTKNR